MFKIGDKVICVDPGENDIVEGETYTIKSILGVNMLNVIENTGTYFVDRFKLADSYEYAEWQHFNRDSPLPDGDGQALLLNLETNITSIKNFSDVLFSEWLFSNTQSKIMCYRLIIKSPVIETEILYGACISKNKCSFSSAKSTLDTHKLTITIIDGEIQETAKIEKL